MIVMWGDEGLKWPTKKQSVLQYIPVLMTDVIALQYIHFKTADDREEAQAPPVGHAPQFEKQWL